MRLRKVEVESVVLLKKCGGKRKGDTSEGGDLQF